MSRAHAKFLDAWGRGQWENIRLVGQGGQMNKSNRIIIQHDECNTTGDKEPDRAQ